MAKQTSEEALARLTEQLTGIYGARLVSLVLHGSLAGSNHHARFSDINVICVLEEVSGPILDEAAAVLRAWEKHARRPVTILARREVEAGADVFPLEYSDIRAHRRLLAGEDVFAATPHFAREYRLQVEHDLRARLIRLRGRYAALRDDRKELEKLLLASAGTFLTLIRHALVAAGGARAEDKTQTVRAAAARFGFSPEPWLRLLAARREEAPLPRDGGELRAFFAEYLAAIQSVERQLEEA